MSDYAIKIEGLGKKYLLQHQAAGRRYVALRDVLAEKAKSLFSNQKSEIGNRKSVEEFWALQDVSFEIKPGEAVGIIGRNGAGKSTLLKVLSRITEPTTGRIRIRGRVASLLEVGTGFHPELTGRENIFLNGAILGMSRVEIKKKFDEIVDFAEVEKFLDTPVKRYSSGMYVRLAFAVAAHLEPEILIVDEVLAVGDAAFQKKCLGKMDEVSHRQGRTILFVSHQMSVVASLCSRVVLLAGGRLAADGSSHKVIAKYLTASGASNEVVRDLRNFSPRKGTGELFITEAEICAFHDGEPLPVPRMGDMLGIRLKIENRAGLPRHKIRLSVSIKAINGQKLVHVCNEDDGYQFPDADNATIMVELPHLLLYPGTYSVSLWAGSSEYSDHDYLEDCLSFEVGQPAVSPRGFKPDWVHGYFLHPSKWRDANEGNPSR
ncbi:MAG: ABC transporter ATP-binding protein [Verrucomicrobiota bacterium]